MPKMSYLAILLFFLYTWCFGYSVTRFLKNSEKFFERNLMNIGIGIGIFSILSVILNLFRIPLNWWLFLILALILPLYDLFRNYQTLLELKNHFRLTKSNLYLLLVLIIFSFTLYMYVKGSFAYPYLEDDDSWEHARSIKYISIEKTAFEPKEALSLPGHGLFHYLDPYPPSYGILLGMLHQISPSLNWTLKFFNSLIISLSIIFSYYFAKEFTNNSQKALLATLVLAAIPAYMSHFIWSLSLSMALYFVAFYCMERTKYDKSWLYATSFVIAGILLTQTTTGFKFAIFFGIYWLIKALTERKFLWPLFLSAPIGALLAFIFWWIPMFFKYNDISHVMRGLGQSGVGAVFNPAAKIFYTFSDFFFARSQNMINSPIGIGVIVTILCFIGIAYLTIALFSIRNKEQASKFSYIPIVFAWLIFNLLSVLGSYLPIRMDFHRSWMLLAFTVAIIAAEAIYVIAMQLKKYNMPFFIPIIVIFTGILFTSGLQKYQLNTTPGWPPGFIWNSFEEIQAYNWLKDNLPIDTKVYPICGSGDKKLIGFDKLAFSWRDEGAWEYKTLDKAATLPAAEAANYIKSKGYDYLVIDGDCVKPQHLGNATNQKIKELVESGRFKPIFQNQGAIILAIS